MDGNRRSLLLGLGAVALLGGIALLTVGLGIKLVGVLTQGETLHTVGLVFTGAGTAGTLGAIATLSLFHGLRDTFKLFFVVLKETLG